MAKLPLNNSSHFLITTRLRPCSDQLKPCEKKPSPLILLNEPSPSSQRGAPSQRQKIIIIIKKINLAQLLSQLHIIRQGATCEHTFLVYYEYFNCLPPDHHNKRWRVWATPPFPSCIAMWDKRLHQEHTWKHFLIMRTAFLSMVNFVTLPVWTILILNTYLCNMNLSKQPISGAGGCDSHCTRDWHLLYSKRIPELPPI